MNARVARGHSPHITVLLVPETDRHTLSFRLPVRLLQVGIALLLIAAIGIAVATTVLVRSYHEAALAAGERDNLRREAAQREFYLHTLRQEVTQIQGELAQLRLLDQEVRRLLGQDTSSPVKLPEDHPAAGGAGGPFDEVAPPLADDMTDLFPPDMRSYLQERRTASLLPSRDQAAPRQSSRTPEEESLYLLAGMREEINLRVLRLAQDAEALREYADYLEHRPQGSPVSGYKTDGYGWRRSPFNRRTRVWHNGLDLAATYGAPVRATGAGEVIFAGWRTGGYGYTVIIDHGYGYTTLYAHNSKVKVQVGDQVSRGDLIALVGSTGHSTGPHVHYEVTVWGRSVDPEPYLK